MENRPPKHMPGFSDTDTGDNRIALEAGIRLRQAVDLAGGPSHISRASRVHLRSLNNYLKGHEMRRDVLVALADACGVSVEWLATGRGHMLSDAQRELLGTRLYEPSPDGTTLIKTAEHEQLIEKWPELARTSIPRERPPDEVEPVDPDADVPAWYHQQDATERLQAAIHQAGGIEVVARMGHVPEETVKQALRGQDVGSFAIYSIAVACHISLDWLISGIGAEKPEWYVPNTTTGSAFIRYEAGENPLETAVSERQEPTDSPAANPPSSEQVSLFATVDIDRFALCLNLIQSAFNRMRLFPDPRRLTQLILLLYDSIDPDNFSMSDVQDLISLVEK